MFGLRQATWSVFSESKPEWRAEGRCKILSLFEKVPEIDKAIKELSEKLNEEPPEDLEYSVMKD